MQGACSVVGVAAVVVLGSGACELVLGTLPPVPDGGPGSGGGAGSTTASSTTASSTTGTTGSGTTGNGGGCPVDETACPLAGGGHACADLATDPQFCGSCGTHCGGGTTCIGMACVAACPPGLTPCGETCVNPQSDPNNCGGCGGNHVCPPQISVDAACQAGGCVLSCMSGMTSCSLTGGKTACVDVTNDPTHCGVCATSCTMSEVCAGGVCQPYVPASSCLECGIDGSALTKCCSLDGQTFCTSGTACP
jgi:hypothetical protein